VELITRSDDERIIDLDITDWELIRNSLRAVIAERDALKNGHCKDCCCARSWEALGIHELTNMSIPEHIAALRLEVKRLEDNEEAMANIQVALADENATLHAALLAARGGE